MRFTGLVRKGRSLQKDDPAGRPLGAQFEILDNMLLPSREYEATRRVFDPSSRRLSSLHFSFEAIFASEHLSC